MLFIGLLFALIVQAIAFTFRLGELGSLFVVILLITQLVSSSGTFPVEMQNIIFRLFHYIAPFTYSIDTFREILSNPSFIRILELQ
jgi:putative membrane protein